MAEENNDGAPSAGATEYGTAGANLRREAQNWERGAHGEATTRAGLLGLPHGYHVFHNIQIGPRGADIDHLVVGPTGVWVIDSKNESYPYRVSAGRLWCGRQPRDQAIAKVGEYAAVVRRRLGVDANATISVVGAFQTGPAAMVGRVRVLDHRVVADHIRNSQRVLLDEAVAQIAAVATNWQAHPAPFFADNRAARAAAAPTPRLSPVPPPPPRWTAGSASSSSPSPKPRRQWWWVVGILVLLAIAGAALNETPVPGPAGSQSGLEAVADAEPTPTTLQIAESGFMLGPLRIEFVCSELKGTYWMQTRQGSIDSGDVSLAISVNGVERYMGEFGFMAKIEAIADIVPGTPITIAASWPSVRGDAPGDLKRSFLAPTSPCPSG